MSITYEGKTIRNQSERYLTGKGGVGLAMFRLAKRRIEFAATSDHCPWGDLWVQVDDRKIGIEVKTCRKGCDWHVNLRQIGGAEFYCLVSMEDADCYVITAAEMKAAAKGATSIYRDIAILPRKLLPPGSLEAWGKITGVPETATHYRAKVNYRHTRRVRHVLRDGSTKLYEYHGTQDRIAAAGA